MYIIMDYASNGDLKKYMKNLKDENLVDEQRISFMILDIVQGIKYLHDKRIIHRDLKPENIVVNGDN